MSGGRNARRLKMLKIAVGSAPWLFGLAMGVATGFHELLDGANLDELGTLAMWTVGTGLFAQVIVNPMGMTLFGSERSPDLQPGMDVGSVRRLVEALGEGAQVGIRADQRMAIARDLAKASDLLTFMCGRPVWMIPSIVGAGTKMPVRLQLRGDKLLDDGEDLIELVGRPYGADMGDLASAVARTAPVIASIARDFGFDPCDFAPSDRLLPGQVAGTQTSVPQIAAPVVALADEWLSGSRVNVPMLLANEADTAARGDLDQLQRAWKTARASATDAEATKRVDETFSSTLSHISRKLGEAIAARSAGDEQDLHIQKHYIESKLGNSGEYGLTAAETGQRSSRDEPAGEAASIELIAAPVVLLADEWLSVSGTCYGVEPSVAEEADRMARADLIDLLSAWQTGRDRAHLSGSTIAKVDRIFEGLLTNISWHLSKAIAASRATEVHRLETDDDIKTERDVARREPACA